MVAILILIVGLLGLLQAINLSMDVNLRNHLREEAVSVGERAMNELRNKGFDNISVASPSYNYATYQVPSKIRGTSKSYSVSRSSTVLSEQNTKPVTKQLEVVVRWTYKGVEYENRVTAPISIIR
jgi:type IV pilus assembly protein PilV